MQPLTRLDRLRYAVAAFLLLTAWLSSGCSRAVTAPSSATRATAPVLVRTLAYAGHAPIAGVSVLVNGVERGVTTDAGELTVTVLVDDDTEIAVQRRGYHGFSDSGRVHAAGECWTFYLEEL